MAIKTFNAKNGVSVGTSLLDVIDASGNWIGVNIPNSKLANSTITIAGTSTALGTSIALDTITGVSTGGFLARTAANTLTARTITGTAGQITVTNGDGVAGAPTISLPAVITQATRFSTSPLAVGDDAGTNAFFIANGTAGNVRGLALRTAGLDRWWMVANATAEGGSNAGSNFQLTAYNDAGSTIDSPIGIARVAGGAMTLTRPTNFTSTTASTSTTTGSATFGGGIGVAGAGYFGGNLTFGTSGSVLNGTTGSIGLTATGTNQSISLAPTGTGTLNVLHSEDVANPILASFMNAGATTAGRYNEIRFGKSIAAGGAGAIGYVSDTVTPTNGRVYLVNYGDSQDTKGLQIVKTSGNVLLGTTTDSSNGRLQLATHTTSAGGIGFGTDTSLYRFGAGNLQVATTGNPLNFDLVKDAGQVGLIRVFSGGGRRWAFGGDGTAETGSNAGTPFVLNAYNDANVFIDRPISLLRVAGGLMTVARPLSVTSTTASTSTTTGALTVAGGMSSQGAAWHGGQVTSSLGAGQSGFIASSSAGQTRNVRFQTAASDRWVAYVDASAESGSNAGSDFYLARYTDAGAFAGNSIGISRATGLVTFGTTGTAVSVAGTTPSTSTTSGALTVAGGLGLGLNAHIGGTIDGYSGVIAMTVGGNSSSTGRTNSTDKFGRIAAPHYNTAEEPLGLILGFSDSTGGRIDIGGGTSLVNASTSVNFYTAANNTTVTGTRRGGFNSSGDFDLTGALNVTSNRVAIGTSGVSDTDTFLTLYPQTLGNSIYHLSNSTGILRFSRGAVGSETTHDMTLSSGGLSVAATTASTSLITGALTVAGGVGVTGNLNLGSDTASTTGFINLRSGSSAASTFSGWRSNTERWRTTYTAADAMEWAYIPTSATALMTLGSTGNLALASTTASTSTTTGSLTTAGGIGVAGAQFLGGNLTFGTSASVLNGTTGSIGLTATGTNQSISFITTGTGATFLSRAPALGLSVSNTAAANGAGYTPLSGVNLVHQLAVVNQGTGHASSPYGAIGFFNARDTNTYDTSFASIAGGKENGTAGNVAGFLDIFTARADTTGARAMRINSAQVVLLGTTTDSSNGKLQLASHTTGAGGIGFGTETTLYRNTAGQLTIGRTSGVQRLTFKDEAQPTYASYFQGAYSDNAIEIGVGSTPLIRSAGFSTPTRVEIVPSTASTSTTTGALTVAGGVGVAGAIFAGSTIRQDASTDAALQVSSWNSSAGTSAASGYGTWNGTMGFGLMNYGTGHATRANQTWLYTIGAYPIIFAANGTESFRVSSTTNKATFAYPADITNTTEATAAGAGSVTTAGGIYAAKRVVTATSFVHGVQTFTGSGAASSTTGVSAITSSGAAQAISLTDGVEGQQKTIIHKADGGSIVITPTTKTGFSSVTLEDAGESVTMIFLSTTGWNIIGNNGATITP